MNRKRLAGIFIVLILLVCGLVGMRMFGNEEKKEVGRVLKTGLATRPTVEKYEMRVGVYLSKFTGDQVGYSCQMTGDLLHHGLDVVPVVEGGSEGDANQAKVLGVYFKGKKPVVVTDVEGLKKLDVIVAPRIWLLKDDARAAIEEAVRNGTGLFIRDGLGCMEPGSGEEVSRLSGFRYSSFGYNPKPMECEVVGESPILGTLTKGTSVMITPNGSWGELAEGMTPLIRVKDMEGFVKFETRGNAQWVFYPVYVGELGKGRIVGCQFPAWERMPKDLQGATGGEFNLRAVRWAGRREGNTTRLTTETVGG